MTLSLRVFAAVYAIATLAACGWGDPGFVRLGDYECDAGEAVVRHLVATAADLDPAVPNEYCIVKSRAPTAVDKEFSARFADLKKTFVSGDGVSFKDELGFPVNPKSGLAPIVLHLVHMHVEPDGSYSVEAAWAYKLAFERSKFRVEKTDGTWKVSVIERIAVGDGKPLGA